MHRRSEYRGRAAAGQGQHLSRCQRGRSDRVRAAAGCNRQARSNRNCRHIQSTTDTRGREIALQTGHRKAADPARSTPVLSASAVALTLSVTPLESVILVAPVPVITFTMPAAAASAPKVIVFAPVSCKD